MIILVIVFQFGCSHTNHSEEVTTENTNSPTAKNQQVVIMDNLSVSEKKLAKSILSQILNVNQLIEELDLLLVELQKTDELQEAVEIMETAHGEAIKIAGELNKVQIKNGSLADFKAMYEEELLDYANGLKLQIEGMETWDGQKTTQGYKLTEIAKKQLKQYYTDIKMAVN